VKKLRKDHEPPQSVNELIKTVPHIAFEVKDIDYELSRHDFNILTKPESNFAGTITDHRNGVATEYGTGLGWPEDRNTTHWLENRGTTTAVEISVDIFNQQ
jgi:hypothetical protein